MGLCLVQIPPESSIKSGLVTALPLPLPIPPPLGEGKKWTQDIIFLKGLIGMRTLIKRFLEYD